tara:strand:- start:438 stop:605 length:168 start_codon:yes stop_codon:yes gene_type:complete
MTDKDKLIALLESADIDYDEWSDHLLVLDNARIEVHFNSKGDLLDIVSVDGEQYD